MDRATAGDLQGAGALLEDALARCPEHVGVLRELAAVRFREGRRSDAEGLARRLVALEPGLDWGWDLLGTLRYLDDDAVAALRAWNRIGRPRLDAVEVLGPAGTTAREGRAPSMTGLSPGSVVTPGDLVRARRRLEAVPAVSRARVSYRPLPGGTVHVEGRVAGHSPHSLTRGAVPAHLARALGGAVRIEASNRAGRGERLLLEGALDRGYREARISLAHPLPNASIARVAWDLTHQVTDRASGGHDVRTERTGGRVTVFPWPTHRAMGSAGIGVDHWSVSGPRTGPTSGSGSGPGPGTHGVLEGSARLTLSRILALQADGSLWTGGFGRTELALETTLDRRTAPGAREEVGGPGPDRLTAGPALRARSTLVALHGLDPRERPDDLSPRFGGRRSSTHPVRATSRVLPSGDAWIHGSLELSRGWDLSTGIIVGAALFADAVRGLGGEAGNPGSDPGSGVVNLGAGLRLGIPGADGWLRADWAVDPTTGRSRASVAWVGQDR